MRRKLPDERKSITHRFSIGGHEGYIIVGKYDDGTLGELFIVMAKEGSTVSGLVDSFAIAISLALQYGVPLKALVDKFSHTSFDPSGWTGHKEIGYAKSIMDYIFRWLEMKFLPMEQSALPKLVIGALVAKTESYSPTCSDCGSIMTSNGSCYKCGNCGSTSGCS